VLVKANAKAWAVALPDAASPFTSAVTKADARSVDAWPEEVADAAAWATAYEAAVALGEELVKFADTHDAASASDEAEALCSKERAGRAWLSCKLVVANTTHSKM